MGLEAVGGGAVGGRSGRWVGSVGGRETPVLDRAAPPPHLGMKENGWAAMDGNLLARITADPRIFEGKPIIRDLRISVEHVLALLAAGETGESIREDFPELEAEDIRACLAYAHAAIAGERMEQVTVAAG